VTVRGRARNGERGGTLAEFAIVLTASLMLMFGVIDFGRAAYTYHLLSNAARMGTRYAIVRGSSCTLTGCPASATDIQTYVRGLAGELNTSSITVDTTWTTSTGCSGAPYQGPGCKVAVSVSYPFHFMVVPLMPAFTMNIASTSTMIISQ
jgi:Flp pilus assembly protein TadG